MTDKYTENLELLQEHFYVDKEGFLYSKETYEVVTLKTKRVGTIAFSCKKIAEVLKPDPIQEFLDSIEDKEMVRQLTTQILISQVDLYNCVAGDFLFNGDVPLRICSRLPTHYEKAAQHLKSLGYKFPTEHWKIVK